jgi:hypothetical protein
MLPLIRTRLALALIAAAGVALELALMRGLAFRFSSHFAGIVISVGLLGFGAAGSLLTFIRPFVLRQQRTALVILALSLVAAIPACWWLSQLVNLNVNFLAWNFLDPDKTDAPSVLLLELLMLLPLMFTGAFIGVALMDSPTRINGHYASDLLGSGIGGIAAVLAMNLLSTAGLLLAITLAAILAALLLLRWRNPAHLITATLALALTLLLALLMPQQPTPNPYKPLTLATLIGNKIIYHADGPLGTIDVADGPSLHGAPQLSLQYLEYPPPHIELFVDGDGPTLIFDCKTPADWQFTDFRTAAAPYHLRPNLAPPKVCIIGAGGGVEIGLATFHQSPDITALEFNPQIIHAMTGPLANRGGSIYSAPGVHILNQEARGFFASTSASFDIIEFPPVGGFGAAGSDATQESYFYTTDSLRLMFQHLSPTGILALTRGISRPPREELRAFDLAAQTLRAENLDPAQHLAMIRGNFSCTILLSKQPLSAPQLAALHTFCHQKGFDPCYFPGITFQDANPTFDPSAKSPEYGDYNIVDLPYYFSGPQALLNLQYFDEAPTRENFLATYPFDISAPTDNQPYFFHTFRWSSYPQLKKEYGEGIHIFLEVSYVMLLVALSQAVLLAIILILLPLAPGIKTLRLAQGKPTTLAYFAMLGLGFMLLEMGLVQKLVLYLAHPIYSAAVVIASFLVFAGIGSTLCRRWHAAPARIITLAAATVVAISAVFLLALDNWLSLTQSWPMGPRCLIAALTIAPLAFAMGHFFPLGLKHTADASPALVPWSWAINGFASVVAAAAAPLLAMRLGISSLTLAAIACYTLAALLFHHMSRLHSTSDPQNGCHEAGQTDAALTSPN